MHDYLAIRTAHARGESKRSIARRLRHSQDTVRAVIASETGCPPPYQRQKPVKYPKLGDFTGIIDSILVQDEWAPLKQRHSAAQIYRRLVSEHRYRGKYDQVRRYVAGHRKDHRQTLIPLRHEPGERIECDFGHVQVDFPQGRRGVDVLVMVWSWSHAPFMMAMPNQRTESVLHGMTEGLHFFHAVPREVWWDNPKTVATTILRGRERVLNPDYAYLASHYRFEPRACMPAKGQEKPDVESGVKGLQRRACTPVPQVRNLDELNQHLLRFCRSELERTVAGQTRTIGQRLAIDRQHAIPLPIRRFDPCVSSVAMVDKYQTVRFENNRYSVPREAAFASVTIKAYIDHIVLLLSDRQVAEHRRCYGRDELIMDPLHYLAALRMRPGALDHSGVFKDWSLPPVFEQLRDRLEREHGPHAGVRHYIRVLQLLGQHSASRVAQAIGRLWCRVHLRAEDIEQKTSHLADADPSGGLDAPVVKNGSSPARDSGAPACGSVIQVHVPPPDLGRFNQLLPSYRQGDDDGFNDNQCPTGDASAAQPQGTASTDDAGRVRQAVA